MLAARSSLERLRGGLLQRQRLAGCPRRHEGRFAKLGAGGGDVAVMFGPRGSTDGVAAGKVHATSPLYDTTHRYLKTHLTEALESQIETLALVVVAISHSVSAQLGKIARAMPLDTTHAAKEQRIRRLLDSERLVQAEHYQR